MNLAAKQVIIMAVALALPIDVVALALLVAIFQLAFYAQRAPPRLHPAPEARHSPRASPMRSVSFPSCQPGQRLKIVTRPGRWKQWR